MLRLAEAFVATRHCWAAAAPAAHCCTSTLRPSSGAGGASEDAGVGAWSAAALATVVDSSPAIIPSASTRAMAAPSPVSRPSSASSVQHAVHRAAYLSI